MKTRTALLAFLFTLALTCVAQEFRFQCTYGENKVYTYIIRKDGSKCTLTWVTSATKKETMEVRYAYNSEHGFFVFEHGTGDALHRYLIAEYFIIDGLPAFGYKETLKCRDETQFKREFNRMKQAFVSGKASSAHAPATFGAEPYTSTAVRDIRKKADLEFDDLFYLCRAKTPLSALRRYYTANNNEYVSLYKLSLSKTLYGHPLSELDLSKSAQDKIWYVRASIYFGPTDSSEAIDEANRFLTEIQDYLAKRGRKVSREAHGYYRGCFRLIFNEGHVTKFSINVVNGGLYKQRNGESAWGVVVHISAPLN